MRQYQWVALALAAGFVVGMAAVVVNRYEPAPKPRVASEPAAGAPTASPLSAPKAAAAVAPPGTAPAPPSATAAEALPPAKSAASDLPTVDVAPLPVHTVPDAEPPTESVTIVDRHGHTLKELKPSAGLSPTYVPSVGPGGASTASRGAQRPALVPPPSTFEMPNSGSASALPGATLGGRASAAGGATLSVRGRSIRLFGVRLADPHDRCGLGAGDDRSCTDAARDALAQRLRHYPDVACRVPPGQRGGDQAAICTDNSGTDLAGFLVGEGYVLADTKQSFDYFGAESAARAHRRGLWRYR